jgi:SAM-dependent methyltransferase
MSGPGPGHGPAFEDHFGGHAAAYAAGRPTYPGALYDALAELAPGRALAWDVATGNGQAAVALAERFDRVIASDASADQLEQATRHPRVTYVPARAETSPPAAAGADLITIAQALHWFAGPDFDAVVRRTIRPGGIVAAWSYGRCTIDRATAPEIDAAVDDLHDRIVGPWWPARRAHVLNGYRDLDLPGEPVELPPVDMVVSWTLPRLLAYVGTWSATRRCRDAAVAGHADAPADPVAAIRDRLEAAWGDPGVVRTVRWPLAVLARRVAGDP